MAQGRNKFMFDADPAVTLRNVTDGPELVTVAELPISLNILNKAYWDNNEIPLGSKEDGDVAVQVAAVSKVNGDETYRVSLEVADDAAFLTNVVEIGAVTVLNPGVYSIDVDPENVKAQSAGVPAFMRVKVTIAGTAPSITYGAWIS